MDSVGSWTAVREQKIQVVLRSAMYGAGGLGEAHDSLSKPFSFPMQDVEAAFNESSSRLRYAFAVLAATTLGLGILTAVGAGGVYDM